MFHFLIKMPLDIFKKDRLIDRLNTIFKEEEDLGYRAELVSQLRYHFSEHTMMISEQIEKFMSLVEDLDFKYKIEKGLVSETQKSEFQSSFPENTIEQWELFSKRF
mmetsp:Transcript_11194/g.18819  ORF Transcript_11194/g.18819 Transcript_11194/m.18819 type:complete len:106 (+) Transcript_11194:829-1146(+)